MRQLSKDGIVNFMQLTSSANRVLLQELRVDTLFPADDATRRFLDTAAKAGIEGALDIRQQA